MAIRIARTAYDGQALGTMEKEVPVSLAIVTKGRGSHPTDTARRFLTVAQGEQAVNLEFVRSLVTLDINSELAASLVVAVGGREQRDLDLDDFAHSLGVLKVPRAELLQVGAKIKGSLELVIREDETGDNVRNSR